MNAEEIRNYVLEKNDVTESFPFGDGVLVFKTNGKIFLLLALNEEAFSFNVKCDPDKAILLREEYPHLILPGYHMNKMHWNKVFPEGLKKVLTLEMIDNSYDLILKKKRK